MVNLFYRPYWRALYGEHVHRLKIGVSHYLTPMLHPRSSVQAPRTAMHGHSVRSESSSSSISSIVPLKANPHKYSHQSELHESFELLECSTYLLALNFILR
jgi:hypothetical protein